VPERKKKGLQKISHSKNLLNWNYKEEKFLLKTLIGMNLIYNVILTVKGMNSHV